MEKLFECLHLEVVEDDENVKTIPIYFQHMLSFLKLITTIRVILGTFKVQNYFFIRDILVIKIR